MPGRGAVAATATVSAPLLVLAMLAMLSVSAPATLARAQEEVARFVDASTSEELRWEDVSSWRDLPAAAVWCGFQYPNDEAARRERAYVARIYRSGSLVPGKATYWGASGAAANSTYSNVPTFEVAVVAPQRVLWVAAAGGSVPAAAPVAGLTRDGQPLYSCKFHFDRRLSMACGAVQRYTERCVAEMDGNLVSSPVYEVMTLLPLGYSSSLQSYAAAPAAVPRYADPDPDLVPRPVPAGRQ